MACVFCFIEICSATIVYRTIGIAGVICDLYKTDGKVHPLRRQIPMADVTIHARRTYMFQNGGDQFLGIALTAIGRGGM